MNEKAFGAIEGALNMLDILHHGTITEKEARTELANARKLLEAAEAWHHFHCGSKQISCDEICKAAAACRAETGQNQNA